jgi:hypothetical protein
MNPSPDLCNRAPSAGLIHAFGLGLDNIKLGFQFLDHQTHQTPPQHGKHQQDAERKQNADNQKMRKLLNCIGHQRAYLVRQFVCDVFIGGFDVLAARPKAQICIDPTVRKGRTMKDSTTVSASGSRVRTH